MAAIEELTETLEKNYLKSIIQFLRDGTFEESEIKSKTREFLALQPFVSLDDIHDKMKTFVTTYPEFELLFGMLLKIIEENKTQDLLSKMRSHLKENDVDGALAIVPKK